MLSNRPQAKFALIVLIAVLALTSDASAAEAAAQAAADDSPFSVELKLGKDASSSRFSGVVQVVVIMTILSILPALLLTMTSFTRIVIVLSFVRRAMSLQQMPPNQVVIGLSLFLTIFVMAPTWEKVNASALQPYLRGEASQKAALSDGLEVMRKFMLSHVREKDLALFVSISKMPRPETAAQIPVHVVIPAFVTSELKTAFQMGFVIFIPFLVIDMVVASVLTSMGMFMLPPIVISVPFKIVLFVLVDGWHLVVRSLAMSF